MYTLELIYEDCEQISVTNVIGFERDPYYILAEFENGNVSGYTTKGLVQFNAVECGKEGEGDV